MKSSLKTIISGALALQLSATPTLAAESSAYYACRDTSATSAAPLSQGDLIAGANALSLATADELLAYLRRGREHLKQMREQIAKLNNGASCQSLRLCAFFQSILPQQHKEMRMTLAWTGNPITQRGYNLGLAENVGNLYLRPPAYGPFAVAHEPLTESERQRFQTELEKFWDGYPLSQAERDLIELRSDRPAPQRHKGVIEEFLDLQRVKVRALSNSPAGAQLSAKQTLAALEASRRPLTAKERIELAMRVSDPSWVAFRHQRLERARLIATTELWKFVELSRPLVYLTQANFNLKTLDSALERSLTDNLTLTREIEELRGLLTGPLGRVWTRGSPSNEARERLLDYHTFVEAALEARPDLCLTAGEMRRLIDRGQLGSAVVLSLAVAAPLVLLFPPAAVVLGTVGSGILLGTSAVATVKMTVDQQREYARLRGEYLAHWTPDEKFESSLVASDSLRESQKDATLAPFALALAIGLPATKTSTITRLWSRVNR